MAILHPLTIEALKYKAQVAEDTHDPEDPETDWCRAVVEDCARLVKEPTTEGLKSSRILQEELENYLNKDLAPKEVTAVVTDLCRSGWYEKHNPRAITTRRVRTRVVDGVRFDTGY